LLVQWVSFVGAEFLLAIVTVGVIALTVIAYWRGHGDDPGLTTEIALILTVLLGGLSTQRPALEGGLAVVVAVLLASRTRLPKAGWRGRKIPAKMPCGDIQDQRTSQCPIRFADHEPQSRRERTQQQNIERKHIDTDGLVSQGKRLDKFPERHVHKETTLNWFRSSGS
jgi:hypothetical protein